MIRKLNGELIVPIALIALGLLLFAPYPCLAGEPKITAKSAILYDKDANQVLFAKNAELPRPPASTTKVMTGILALELASMNEKVIISKHAASVGGASIYLSPGEIFTVKDLLLGALIKSGNDAAVALAEAVGGSEEFFVNLMNRKAVLLGARNTHFTNTNGLPAKDHYSTAYDLALITDYALDNPVFAQMVKMKYAKIPENNSTWKRYLRNTNRLLGTFPGVNGVKTGTTYAAGQCLIASAVRENHTLISVVLKSGERYGDTVKLLQYGFNEFKNFHLPKGSKAGTMYFAGGQPYQVDLIIAEKVNYTVPRKALPTLERKVTINEVKLPLKKGEIVGFLHISAENLEPKRIPIVAKDTIRPVKMQERIKKYIKNIRLAN